MNAIIKLNREVALRPNPQFHECVRLHVEERLGFEAISKILKIHQVTCTKWLKFSGKYIPISLEESARTQNRGKANSEKWIAKLISGEYSKEMKVLMDSERFWAVNFCGECGKMFRPSSAKSRFCSHECRRDNYNRVNQSLFAFKAAEKYRSKRHLALPLDYETKRPICGMCGLPIPIERFASSRTVKFCSKGCGGKHSNKNNPNRKAIIKKCRKKRNLNGKNRAEKRIYFRTNIQARISKNLRNRMRLALISAGKNKSGSLSRITGASKPVLMAHLESKFMPGMTWENYGEWHVDHKIPCASFDLTTAEKQAECFHFSNLQPLWAWDNITKGKKLL